MAIIIDRCVINFDLKTKKIVITMISFEYYYLIDHLNWNLMLYNSHLFYVHLTRCKILQSLKYEL